MIYLLCLYLHFFGPHIECIAGKTRVEFISRSLYKYSFVNLLFRLLLLFYKPVSTQQVFYWYPVQYVHTSRNNLQHLYQFFL